MKFLIFTILFFLSFSCAKRQQYTRQQLNNAINSKPNNLKQKIFVRIGDLGGEMMEFQKKNNFFDIKFMDENQSIDRAKNILDEDKFQKYLIALYPKIDDKGICYIDFESPYFDDLLFEQKGSQKFNESMRIYVHAYQLGKKLRPNVQFGFYNFPSSNSTFGNYWQANEKFDELFRNSDIFFPSLYLSGGYKDNSFEKNFEYVKSNIELALSYGKKYNKPVYPFIMHRNYAEDKKVMFSNITFKEWKEYIQMLTTTSYQGKYIDGVVWWGADDFYYDREEGKNILKGRSFTSKEEFIECNDKELMKYSKILLNTIEK